MEYLPKVKDTNSQPSFDHWKLYNLLSVSDVIEFGIWATS